MRNYICKLYIVLFGAALVSCAQELLPVNETPEVVTNEKPATHTILINAGHDGNTRTQIGAATDNMYASLWSEGDRLAVYQAYPYGKDGIKEEIKRSDVGDTSDGGKTMVFSVDFDPVEEDYFIYRAIYPNASLVNYSNTIKVTLPRTQFPTATSFDPKADILISRPIKVYEQPDELNLVFKRHSALVQMTLNGVPEGVPQNAVIHNVVFYSSIPLSGEKWMYADQEGTEMWNDWDNNGFSREIIMNYEGKNLSPFSSDGFKAQFMCVPGEFVEEDYFSVIVTLDVDGSFWGGYGRHVEFTDDMELVFSEGLVTGFSVDMSEAGVEQLPPFTLEFTEWTMETSPELAEGRLDIPAVVNNSTPKSADSEGRVWIEFETDYPWSVYFSEPWLSASIISGQGDGYFQLYAEANETSEPRQAIMTIASDYGGKFEYTVTQAALILPESISVSAPASVTPYTVFNVQANISPVAAASSGGEFYVYDDEGGDCISWLTSDECIAVKPGTVKFKAVYYYGENYYIESEPFVMQIDDVTGPLNWIYLFRSQNKPYLTYVGDFLLSDNEAAQANNLAFSEDKSLVYVVGAIPNADDDLIPCMWTCDGTSIQMAELNMPLDVVEANARKVVVDGTDIYILAEYKQGDNVAAYYVLKNNVVLWSGAPAYTIYDMAVENGIFYLCGSSQFNSGNWSGGDPYLWIYAGENEATQNSLEPYTSTTYYQQHYFPYSIVVQNGQTSVVGYMQNRDKYSVDRGFAMSWINTYLDTRMSSTKYQYFCSYDQVLMGDHRLVVGESFINQNNLIVKRDQTPALYLDEPFINGHSLPVNYSDAACINEIQLFNGIPVLRGTANGTPAFWEAPWKEPMIWSNTDDEVIGFLVK